MARGIPRHINNYTATVYTSRIVIRSSSSTSVAVSFLTLISRLTHQDFEPGNRASPRPRRRARAPPATRQPPPASADRRRLKGPSTFSSECILIPVRRSIARARVTFAAINEHRNTIVTSWTQRTTHVETPDAQVMTHLTCQHVCYSERAGAPTHTLCTDHRIAHCL